MAGNRVAGVITPVFAAGGGSWVIPGFRVSYNLYNDMLYDSEYETRAGKTAPFVLILLSSCPLFLATAGVLIAPHPR
jgi:hypothetical protein